MISRRWAQACAVGLACIAIACGGDDDDDTRGAQMRDASVDGGADAQAASGAAAANGSDGGKTISNAFAIYGRVGSAPGDKRRKQTGDAGVVHSITHVMAVNPATATPVKRVLFRAAGR